MTVVIQAMNRITIGLFALIALSACAFHGEPPEGDNEDCMYPNTLTCDRFAGENYNCTCERGTKLEDIIDVY